MENESACLFLQDKNYNSCMKEMLKQFQHKEEVCSGYIAHSKIIIITKENEVTDETIIYIGSHNFTKSAWGAWGV